MVPAWRLQQEKPWEGNTNAHTLPFFFLGPVQKLPHKGVFTYD